MSLGSDERDKELKKLLDEIGERVESEMKQTYARLKDYYTGEYNAAVYNCQAECRRGDNLMALFYQMQASKHLDVLKELESM
jgi:hypothetical protein